MTHVQQLMNNVKKLVLEEDGSFVDIQRTIAVIRFFKEFKIKRQQMLAQEKNDLSPAKRLMERELFREQSKIKKSYFNNYISSAASSVNTNINSNPNMEKLSQTPTVADILQLEKDAEQLTQEILSEVPSGDVGSRDTLLHLLNGMSGASQCMFYDSSKTKVAMPMDSTMHLLNNNNNTNDDNNNSNTAAPAAKMVITLDSIFGNNKNTNHNSDNGDEDSKHDNSTVADAEIEEDLMIEMQQYIQQNNADIGKHPILYDYRYKLSMAHGVDISRINILDVFAGSFNIEYEITELCDEERDRLLTDDGGETDQRMQQLFNGYKTHKIHPLLFQKQFFDISMFDERGRKDFSTEKSVYEVGPAGKKQMYIQPNGWIRYGLTVLDGKYGKDHTWLHPFQHKNNWYRAFHGTANKPDRMNGVEAMASIKQDGFTPSGKSKYYGAGVYCSPDPVWLETSKYVATQKLETKQGTKTFKYMLQVAVNPDAPGLQMESTYNANTQRYDGPSSLSSKRRGKTLSKRPIWLTTKGADIRPYGILIKEI